MRVRIYHSIDPDYMFRRWQSVAPMKLVDDYQIAGWRQGEHPDSQVAPGVRRYGYLEGASAEEILELIYRDQNAVDGSERNVMMRNRSLSVGDVVMLDEKAYAVDMIGFVNVEAMWIRKEGA